MFKIVGLIKRVSHNTSHNLGHIWEELVKVKNGFRILKDDFKFYIRVKKQRINYKYDESSYKQDMKIK